MPLDYGMIRQFGQQPTLLQDVYSNLGQQNRLAQLAQERELGGMRIQQAQQQMQRAPILQEREDLAYQQAQEEALRKGEEARQFNEMIGQLPQQQQLAARLAPKEWIASQFAKPKPEDVLGEKRVQLQEKELEWKMKQPREKAEKLIPVIGPDGQTPILVPQSQAAGMTPFSAAGKGAANKKMTPEQVDQASLTAQQALDQASKIFSHPGKKYGTGITSKLGAIPGTDEYGFQANLDTFKAQTFIPLVQALKGMGALSDAEGKKLSESVGALKPGMKQSEFDANLKEATTFLFNKAKASGLNVNLPEFAIDMKKQPIPTQTKSGATASGW